MSDIVDAAVKALNERLGGDGHRRLGQVRDRGRGRGAHRRDRRLADDGEADCTLTASAETFQGMLDGDLDPTGAFMSGRLTVDGDMGLAMKLGSLLA